MNRGFAKLVLAAWASLLAAGCGQKGPLYLPGDPTSIQTEIPPEPANPPEDTDSVEDDDNGR